MQLQAVSTRVHCWKTKEVPRQSPTPVIQHHLTICSVTVNAELRQTSSVLHVEKKSEVKAKNNIKQCQRRLQSKRSAYLAHIVKREPEEEGVRDGLDNAKESVNNPVGQPLRVILFNGALNGLYTDKKRRAEEMYRQKATFHERHLKGLENKIWMNEYTD